ncbi:MAG: tetratricopeptide repeat protein [candidate division Zixibacteria bacterium]|nr:tetratricopeptide repeat protein [candidate division Zixibacteria bacterium]
MKRSREHILEEESKRAFINLLPSEWIHREKHPDYGIDMEVEIVEGDDVTNKVFWVQLKATGSIKLRQKKIIFKAKTDHLRFWETCRLPVFIIYWIKAKDIFYYLFVQKYIREILSLENYNWREKKFATIRFPLESELKDVTKIKSIADEGYFYIMEQQLNEKQKIERGIQAAHYWLDGIPQSDNEQLKDLMLKALRYELIDNFPSAIKEYENILRVCSMSPSQHMSVLLNLGNAHYSISQNKDALKNYKVMLELAKKISKKEALEGKSAALGNIGLIYSAKGELDNALKYHKDALKIDREIGYKQGEAAALGNIGLIYSDKGDLEKALKYHKDAFKIHREIGYKQGEAAALGNIGLIYSDKGDLEKALKYHKDALKIDREIGYKQGEALDLDAIGLIFISKGNSSKALKYMNDALTIHKDIGHKWGEALSLGNIGLIYSDKGELDNALKYHKDALKIDREIGYKQGEALDLGHIGIVYKRKDKPGEALKYLKDALNILDRYKLVYGRDFIQNAIDSITKTKVPSPRRRGIG